MTIHAWIAAAEKARQVGVVTSPAATPALRLRSAMIAGPLEAALDEGQEGCALELNAGSFSVVRRTRPDYDWAAVGARARDALRNENEGPFGRRQDFIAAPYIALVGIGAWADEYLRRTEEVRR